MINLKSEGIILEKSNLDFESKGVFNPACIKSGDVIHMFYRAISKNDVSSIGYCQLADNKKIIKRSGKPILLPEHEYEKMGVEDPRIVFIEDKYYMTYTAFDGKNALIAYATSDDLAAFKKHGVISPLLTYEDAGNILKALVSGEKYIYYQRIYEKIFGKKVLIWDKDACLFPKKINGKYALLHRIFPNIQISYFDDFSELNEDYWKDYLKKINQYTVLEPISLFENEYVGAGCPPIATREGWLLLYHCAEQLKEVKIYHAGAALLDINNPLKVIARLKTPLFSPKEEWEKIGNVNNVVFPTGAVIDSGIFYIYYGAADKLIALKSIKLDSLLEELKKETI
jgi:predicted GH43/DUF377 family glycosyl hydrolase